MLSYIQIYLFLTKIKLSTNIMYSNLLFIRNYMNYLMYKKY